MKRIWASPKIDMDNGFTGLDLPELGDGWRGGQRLRRNAVYFNRSLDSVIIFRVMS